MVTIFVVPFFDLACHFFLDVPAKTETMSPSRQKLAPIQYWESHMGKKAHLILIPYNTPKEFPTQVAYHSSRGSLRYYCTVRSVHTKKPNNKRRSQCLLALRRDQE